MNKLIRIALPLLVLAGAALGGRLILSSPPEAERREPRVSLPAVEATRLQATDYSVQLRSQGIVNPSNEAALVPEVAGTITGLHSQFVVGGAFDEGDVLVQIDERDYTIALTRALASLAQADAARVEQDALASVARADWEALGRRRSDASALMLREPQAAAAAANLEAARAEVEKARLDLTRTRIIAPWDGRVLARDVEVGQFVNRGTPIGRIHAVDSVDVRLPISARQLEFLDLTQLGAADTAPRVTLVTTTGSVSRRWNGQLMRTEGIDAATQQLNVIARVPQPYADAADPLRVGRVVTATIDGRLLSDVFVIPRGSLREGREVLILDESDGSVRRRPVVVAWSDEDVVVVREGLASGEVLVLTPLAAVVDGAPVSATIDGQAPPLGEELRRPREGGPRDGPPAEGA